MRNYPPGDHGRGRARQSEYRLQLSEKQKATGENLLRLLETRFDNVLVRLGFAASRRSCSMATGSSTAAGWTSPPASCARTT